MHILVVQSLSTGGFFLPARAENRIMAGMTWIKRLGSLPFAISLLVLLALTLVLSTFLESLYGTPFAQKTFYTTLWFDAVLALIALNLICAALSRWPFKKRHVGFVITHIGIVTLLSGAFLSRLLGSEGQISVFEGETDHRITVEGHVFVMKGPAGERRIELGQKNRLPIRQALPGGVGEIRLTAVREHAVRNREWIEGAPGDASNRTVWAELASESTGLRQEVRLAERGGEDDARIGPARFVLKTPGEKAPALLKIRRAGGDTFEVDVRKTVPPPLPLGGGLTIVKMRYLPAAKVDGAGLVNAPEEVVFNPAVEFTVADASGRTEEHTKLSLFPQFASLKGGAANDVFGLEVELEAELPEGHEPAGALFTFVAPAAKGEPWRYKVASSKSAAAEGVLREGEPVVTGWMDMKLTPKRLIERARPDGGLSFDEKNPAGRRAVEFEAGGRKQWVVEGERATLSTNVGAISFQLAPNSRQVPFVLRLEDFRKKDYPGTTNPASFESDVTLVDPGKGVSIRRTISMNKPLDYAGWRIFQSSYMQDDEEGEGSVFTVAKNPGIPLIYGGSLVILAGVILLFYFHPFFTGKDSE